MKPDPHTAPLALPPAPGELTTHDALALARTTCPALKHLTHDAAMDNVAYRILLSNLAEALNRKRAAQHGGPTCAA